MNFFPQNTIPQNTFNPFVGFPFGFQGGSFGSNWNTPFNGISSYNQFPGFSPIGNWINSLGWNPMSQFGGATPFNWFNGLTGGWPNTGWNIPLNLLGLQNPFMSNWGFVPGLNVPSNFVPGFNTQQTVNTENTQGNTGYQNYGPFGFVYPFGVNTPCQQTKVA